MTSAADARSVLAIDVGGTSIKASLVDGTGQSTRQSVRPTPVADGPGAVVAAIRGLVVEHGRDAAAVGVVVPGDVDREAGMARYSANLGWRDVELREILGRDTAAPVTLDHDVAAAGVAERTVGLAEGESDCLIVVIGTGIAAVAITGGKPIIGARHLSGELGHVPVWPAGERCACRQRGCLEAYASAAAVTRRYAAIRRAKGARPSEPLSAEQVVAARAVDPVAARVWQEAVDALAIALTSATMLLDPALIVLSGGLSEAGDALLRPVQQSLAARITWRPAPRLVGSDLGSAAGRVGAAILAWRSLGRRDFSMWTPALAVWSGSA